MKNVKALFFTTVISVISTMTASAFAAEPTREEILGAIKADAESKKDGFDRAIDSLPAKQKRLCNLWGYIEPEDYTVVDKNLSSDKAQYKLAVKMRFTKDMADIRKDDKCVGDAYVKELGLPKKNATVEGAFYKRPISFTLAKFDKGWRLLEQ